MELYRRSGIFLFLHKLKRFIRIILESLFVRFRLRRPLFERRYLLPDFVGRSHGRGFYGYGRRY